MSTPDTAASDKPKEINARDTCLGCGCITAIAIGIIWGITTLVGGDHSDQAAKAAAATSRPASAATQQPAATAPEKADTGPSPAQKLADLDGDDRPASDYQQILDQFAPKCTQSPERLAALTHGTLTVLQNDGINDETEYSVLTNLNESVPAGSPKMDCQSIAAAYVTIRES